MERGAPFSHYQLPKSISGFEKMKKATPEQAVAATTVFWDIKSCPVPLGFDARQVGPSIKRFLKNLGYSGPLTIKASGILTNVPGDILRAFSSTGIVLNHVSRGTEDIESLLYVWGMENISLANVMVISTPPNCSHVLKSLSEWGLNVIYPFPYEEEETADVGSLWINSLLMAAPEELEEDKCRETGESSDLWVCSVCHDYEDRGFENFISHLSCLQHRVMLSLGFSRVSFEGRGSYPVKPSPKATPGDDVAETSVFWDITRCPVPPGFDARQVGPLIKRFLKNLGYSGPLTITAVGILTHVPEDILRAVSSTGIVLNHVSCLSEDIERLLSRCSMKDKSPAAANVMVITTPPSYSSILSTLSQRGLNVIYPFPYEEEEETADLGSLWINSLLMADSEELEEDKCRETGESASWVCLVCHNDGRGFENFITHLSSRKHA